MVNMLSTAAVLAMVVGMAMARMIVTMTTNTMTCGCGFDSNDDTMAMFSTAVLTSKVATMTIIKLITIAIMTMETMPVIAAVMVMLTTTTILLLTGFDGGLRH